MKRRTFIFLASAAVTVPFAASAGSSIKYIEYDKGVVAEQLAAGKTVFVDFYTDWCSTCRSQGRTIDALRRANPAYSTSMVFVKVNWDFFSGSKLAKKYKIPRRSTLLLLKGKNELGRIVAGTSKNKIRALMNKGLATS